MSFSTEGDWPQTLLNTCRTTSSRDPLSQEEHTLFPDYTGHTVVPQPIFSRKQSGGRVVSLQVLVILA